MSDSPRPPAYDSAFGAWVLSRYADVAAALNEPCLTVSGDTGAPDAHLSLRQTAADTLAPTRIVAWRREMEVSARRFAQEFKAGQRVDLVRDFAQPWALSHAILITGAAEADRPRLNALARQIFLAAAHSTDGNVPEAAQAATSELAQALASKTDGPSLAVQAFVALSQTLPCLLAGAWLALLQNPDQAAPLRADPAALPRALDELLRHAGPARAVFRHARSDISIGSTKISAGERVILRLAAANHDPARFAHPDQLDFTRDASGVLAFGRGAHYCAGAALVRAALLAATSAMLDLIAVESIEQVEWLDAFAIRGPLSLYVNLR